MQAEDLFQLLAGTGAVESRCGQGRENALPLRKYGREVIASHQGIGGEDLSGDSRAKAMPRVTGGIS